MMDLVLKNIAYHREKDKIELTEPQALLLVSDVAKAALAQAGFTCDIEIQSKE